MSDMTGADLGQLDALADEFQRAGGQMEARAGDLHTDITTAIGEFNRVLDDMAKQARDLSSAMNDEMGVLKSKADGVQWTGSNRDSFNGSMQRFQSDVTTGTTNLNTDIGTLQSQVASNFNAVLEQFGGELSSVGSEVNAFAVNMRGTVAQQRENLDQAANTGWDSA